MKKETTEVTNVVEMPTKLYEFRRLEASDVFLMFQIISAIGVNKFSECFKNESIKNLFTGKKEEAEEDDSFIVGAAAMLEIANVIFANISEAEKPIYQMLAQTSNLTLEQVEKLDAVTFAEMVIDFVKKEEFLDFIKVVSKLFK